MLHPVLRIPSLGKQTVQRAQSKLPRRCQIQHPGNFQISRDTHRIPTRVHRPVDIRCRTQQPRCIHLLLSHGQQRARLTFRNIQPPRDFLHWSLDVEHILRRIVMHVPNFQNVVVERRDRELIRAQRCFRFRQRPGEIIAVIVHRIVRILRSVKAAASAVAEPFIHPADNVARHPGKKLIPGCLISVHIVFQ